MPDADLVRAPLTLDELADDPSRVSELSRHNALTMMIRISGLVVALSARVTETTEGARSLDPPLTLEEAAPILGMTADTLRRKTKSDPVFRAMVFDNSTDRILFDAERIAAFRRRRTG